jgi:hypothetical protein
MIFCRSMAVCQEEIAEAMRICDHSHDAGIGFNWDTLQFAIDYVKGAEKRTPSGEGVLKPCNSLRMSVPSALLPPAGGVFNAVPSR